MAAASRTATGPGRPARRDCRAASSNDSYAFDTSTIITRVPFASRQAAAPTCRRLSRAHASWSLRPSTILRLHYSAQDVRRRTDHRSIENGTAMIERRSSAPDHPRSAQDDGRPYRNRQHGRHPRRHGAGVIGKFHHGAAQGAPCPQEAFDPAGGTGGTGVSH